MIEARTSSIRAGKTEANIGYKERAEFLPTINVNKESSYWYLPLKFQARRNYCTYMLNGWKTMKKEWEYLLDACKLTGCSRKEDTRCTYNVILRRFRETIFAVEKQ
jgi:hypothetical protein